MSATTKIAWCDSTVNFWEGCTKVSAGCANCYAEARDKRFTGGKLWGNGAPRRKSKSAVKAALAYNRKPWICDECGEAARSDLNGVPINPWCDVCGLETQWHRRRIFSLSLGDWLDEAAPIEWLAEMLDTIRQCDQVVWVLCTKRPENFHILMSLVEQHHVDRSEMVDWLSDWRCGTPPANIILLTSVENQEQADRRIPELMKIPAVCHGLSLEPLLGAVGLSKWLCYIPDDFQNRIRPEAFWLICGGESGSNARPCNVDWIRSLVSQGKSSGVATFVKQLGSNPVHGDSLNDHDLDVVIHDKKGGDITEFPKDLRVREWPEMPTR